MRLWNIITRSLFTIPASTVAGRSTRHSRPTVLFRPCVHTLEDRTVPSGVDTFAGATILSGSTVAATGSNAMATGELGEPNHAGTAGTLNSVWWQWTAQTSGNVEVNTFGSDFDTVLGVYTGTNVGALDLVADNDDDQFSSQSQVYFDAVAGTTYHIAVDGFAEATGNIILHLGMTPANDDLATATVVAGGTVTGSNVAATGEVGEPAMFDAFDPTNSVWWQWVASEDGWVNFDTVGSDFDTGLAVYTGDTVDNLTLVAANDDFDLVGGPSRVGFNAIAGTTYLIAVDGFLNLTGNITLNLPDAPISPPPPPANVAPSIGAQSFVVNENSAAGTVVGTVVANDTDIGQTLTYAITDGNVSGAFAIDSTTGQVTVANASALDFESISSFALTVQVTDNAASPLSAAAIVTITLADTNDAPVLANGGAMSLGAINQGATNNAGTLITDILASTGENRISDQDAGGVRGIAVTGANTAHGIWQFSTNNGSTWSALGAVSDSSARLLAADANTRVRFVPAAGYNGTVTPGIAFHAWDQTAGSNGGLGDASVTGGTSAFSAASATADITVLSSVQQIQLLMADIGTLVNSGVLTAQQAGSSQAKLDVVAKKIDQGNRTAAINNMNAFINQINAFIKAGVLSPAQGQELIQAANAVIVSIEN